MMFFTIFREEMITVQCLFLYLNNEHEYSEAHGIGAFLDLDFVTRECNGIRKTSISFSRDFLELTLLFMLGNEIVEVLKKRGRILPLSSFIGN